MVLTGKMRNSKQQLPKQCLEKVLAWFWTELFPSGMVLFGWLRDFNKEVDKMRIGMRTAVSMGESSAANANSRGRRLSRSHSDITKADNPGWMASGGNTLQKLVEIEAQKKKEQLTEETTENTPGDRSEASKVYEAALNGSKGAISSIRTTPKVPYGYLAKDGVITYNGVVFTCDEKTNSICLGDMTDRKQVINIPLSGGGHLKVNRENLGQLSKAIGMFAPEDVNLILRAIHLDTKVQSLQNEVDDLEAGIGDEIASGDDAAKTDGKAEEN